MPHLIDLPANDINFNEAIRVALTAIWTAEPTPPIPSLVRYLHDGGWHGKDAAADALIFLKDRGGEQAPLLADVLSGDNDDVNVWEEAAATRVLGRLGEYATPYVALLARLAQDRKTDEKLRVAAIRALGVLGPHAKDHVPLLSQLLADRQAHSDVRVAAADALRAFAPRVKDQVEVDELAALLTPMAAHFEIFVVSDAVERALVDFGPIKLEDVPSILIHRYVHMEHTGRIRFLTHLLGGADPAVTNLLDWVGGPARLGSTDFGEDTAAAEEIISIFRNIWSSTQQYPAVRDDLVDKLEAVAAGTNWKRSHRELLTDVADDLDRANYHSEATAIRLSVREEPQSLTELGRLATALAAGHVLFWLLLIYVYPKSRTIQAIFFWNRRVRLLVGLGYVSFVLTWVPFFRNRLFAPFRHSLVAAAHTPTFDNDVYFEGAKVRLSDGTTSPIATALARIDGHMILEGESGLGKTRYLRHLVENYSGLVVYLIATECERGVLEAIQARLAGPAGDAKYLNALIYIGALDVIIDGLNEVPPDVRVNIIGFSQRIKKGNVLLTTQPMVWDPPPNFAVLVMQNLDDGQILDFLASRQSLATIGDTMSADAFGRLCQAYVDKYLSSSQSAFYRMLLSNPMDLTIVAQMLAEAKEPNLFQLHQQYFQLMASTYERQHAPRTDFPLKRFSEHVYERRIADDVTFIEGEVSDELAVMAKYRMIVPKPQPFNQSEAVRRWVFRHDKIMDYFLVKALSGTYNYRQQQHFGDPRFRGTFLLMINILPLVEAELLERELVVYASDTRDHSLSDDFVRLLRSRKAA